MQALREARHLVDAIQSEDLSETRRHLLDGANPNLILPEGVSAFHLAVGIECEDALDFVKVMLQYGGNPNVRSTDGMTPVLIAAAYGRYQALCMLLERGGDPTVTDETGQNALEYAKISSSWDCVNLLKDPWQREEKSSDESSPEQNISVSTSLEDSSMLHYPQTGKVISETYLASQQGFDVTSPDNPIWFFKGSPGSTVVECSGLDKTVMFTCNNVEESSTTAGASFVTCDESLNKDQKRLSFNESSLLMTSDLSSSEESLDSDRYIISKLPSANSSVTSSCDSFSQVVDESCMSFIHHDKDADTVLIERQCPSASEIGSDSSFDVSADDVTVIYDWQGYQSLQNDTQECIQIPSALLLMTDQEIRQQLTQYGYNCGPITTTTRKVYLQRLHRLQSDPAAVAALVLTDENQGFRFQLASYVNGNLSLPSNMAELEIEMVKMFEETDRDNWREGKLKSSFNYLLLDPRVSNNLPLRYTHMTELEAFTVFVSAVFYVGKGKRNRPYSHFNEALHYLKKDAEKPPGAKVKHILDIWEEGHGVVSLHCFQNVIPVEAYTREACMMDAIGLKRLTNAIKGNYYGEAASWSAPKQRTMGVYLLKKASQIFLIEGERQIRPADIVIGQ